MRAAWARWALAAVTAVHLVALAADWTAAAYATKPLLMPVLAGYVFLAAAPRRPWLLLAAVACGWAGDVLLQFEPLFLAGMGAFAAGHVCYQVLFVREGRWRTRRTAVASGAYGVVLAAMLALLWPGLPAGLHAPVAVYSLLLAATAVLSTSAGAAAGLGGALFLASDGLIAAGIADLPRPPGVDVLIMAAYVLGQYLLAHGALTAHDRAHGGGPAPVATAPAAADGRV